MELDARLAGYLRTNRDFMAPVVEQGVGSLGLAPGSVVMDAGTGAGGALPVLARAVGPEGHVTAVDLDPQVVDLAREHAVAAGLGAIVDLRAGDVRDLLAAPSDSGWDAIWASDLVWPDHFDDPPALVALMAGALRPGGVLALFYSNYYQATFLPGRSVLQRKLFAASELRWNLPGGGPHHHERHLAWLAAAGLEVDLRVFPRLSLPGHEDPTVRAYLESTVWPELRESADARGAQAGLLPDELDELDGLAAPHERALRHRRARLLPGASHDPRHRTRAEPPAAGLARHVGAG